MARDSSIDTSTSSPPIRRDAAAPPGCRCAANRPESHSPIWPPTNTGARSGSPRAKPDDRARPRLQCELGGGLVAPRALQPEGRDRRDDQVRVGAEDLGRARATRARPPASPGTRRRHRPTRAAPCSDARSSAARGVDDDAPLRRGQEVEERAVVVGRDRPRPRPTTGATGRRAGGSTLMTSAPPSASSLVQYAPAIHVERSTTRSPLSGDSAMPPLRAGDRRHVSRIRRRRRPDLLSRHSGG